MDICRKKYSKKAAHNSQQNLDRKKKTTGGGGAGIVTPIFKKGGKGKAENCRGIILMVTEPKTYTEIFRKKSEKEMEDKGISGETQTA